MIKLEEVLTLDNVENLTTLNKGYTDRQVSALATSVSDIMEDVSSSIDALETGKSDSGHTHSNYASSVETTGSGNAITAISQSGNKITATKGATFLTAHQDISAKADKSYVDSQDTATLNSAKSYTNTKISELINGAPTTLDTLGEVATAMEENKDVVEALEAAVGSKANASDLQEAILSFTNVSVAATAWASDTTYTDFPYRAAVSCNGVTTSHAADVNFALTNAISGNFAPVTATATNIVYIYAKTKPTSAMTIPYIEARKAVN